MISVLGIGNAIIDVFCKVPDEFLLKNSLTKGTMKLIDESEFNNLISHLNIENTVSGGSVANSIVGLSQLGNKVGFVGKISDDSLGQKYEEGLAKDNVSFLYTKKKEVVRTGTCLILITPDSERTMCTYLGIAGKINENDLCEKAIKNSKLLFLEGYLWDKGEPKKAFEKAINCSNKVAMSLSDVFCVKRHKENFLDLVKNQLDIVFCNEKEVLELFNTSKFNDVIQFAKKLHKKIIITRGEFGSIVITDSKIFEFEAEKNLNIKDLTGAGDLFAAGFLHGIINNLPNEKCLEYGTRLSSKVIQKIGARIDG